MKKIVSLCFLAFLCLLPSGWAVSEPKNFGYVDPQTNRTFVPIRFLSAYAGASIQWDPAAQQIDIVKDGKKLTLFIGKTTAYVDQTPIALEDVPFIDQGVTFVPLRLVSDTLGMQLKWRTETSSVSVTLADQTVQLPIVKRTPAGSSTKPIVSAQQTYKVGGHSFTAQVVTISLMHPKIQLDVALAGDAIGKVEELSSIAKRNHAIVAINGTFFDAYTKGAYKAPYGYIVSSGKIRKKSSGDLRTMFIYDKNNLAELIPGADFTERFEGGQLDGGLQVGPRLLKDGKVSLNVKAEGFRDPKILTGGGARSALGITRDHKLILLTTGGATIPQLAEIMKQAGAYQAMNLDGGASSGLYYDGKYMTQPGRKISNALLIKYN